MEKLKHQVLAAILCSIQCALLSTPTVADSPDPSVPLAFDLQTAHDLQIRQLQGGEYELMMTGNDPFVVLNRFDSKLVPESHSVLAFEYFAPSGGEGLTVYYGPPIQGHRHFAAGKLNRSVSWQPFGCDLQKLSEGEWSKDLNQLRLDFGRTSGIVYRIRNLHLRASTLEERRIQSDREAERQQKLESESRINAFYRSRFHSVIDMVRVERKRVFIRGRLSAPHPQLRLLELRPEVSLANHSSTAGGEFLLSPQPGVRDHGTLSAENEFEFERRRIQDSVDRTTSRWTLAEKHTDGSWKLYSHWKYATDLSVAAANDLPQITPPGLKGMAGVTPHFPLEELVELGVHNITINILLTSIMDSVPRQGWVPFQQGSRTWYVNHNQLATYDRLTQFAAENKIVVSGILLINFSNSPFGQLLIHPEADRAGHYAMPNLTTEEGVAAYEAVLEFLAKRYSNPDSALGRITNWIIHNEIGYGWEWTNMGKQPPMLYMDHYLRSLRLVHNVTRRHDPHSRVFISLTHHWNTPSDPDWKTYSNFDLLQRLNESSRIEGDFAWGVAFHPYPQDLRRPDAWNDSRVTQDFDTPLITPKNIAVLDRWMERDEMRDASGNVRGLLLSEQGFNCADDSIGSQRQQAAGLVYMWRQMRGLKNIEAFHNHRWVDNAKEGGLLLGLRKLPANDQPYGDKKLSWEVYKALETSSAEEVTRFANALIKE